MIKQIKLEEAVALTKAEGSQCIATEILLCGYFDTWIVKYLGEDYRFRMYTDKYSSWTMLNPQMVELTKVKLVEKTVVTTEWVECE